MTVNFDQNFVTDFFHLNIHFIFIPSVLLFIEIYDFVGEQNFKMSRFCSALERRISSTKIREARKGHRVVYRLMNGIENIKIFLFDVNF